MLMNCKRKIHEKLVFENAPQNPEAIKVSVHTFWRCFPMQ